MPVYFEVYLVYHVFLLYSELQNQSPTDWLIHFVVAALDVPVFCFQNSNLICFSFTC